MCLYLFGIEIEVFCRKRRKQVRLHTVSLIRKHYPQIVVIINLVEWLKSRYGIRVSEMRKA